MCSESREWPRDEANKKRTVCVEFMKCLWHMTWNGMQQLCYFYDRINILNNNV